VYLSKQTFEPGTLLFIASKVQCDQKENNSEQALQIIGHVVAELYANKRSCFVFFLITRYFRSMGFIVLFSPSAIWFPMLPVENIYTNNRCYPNLYNPWTVYSIV
jgi:hypothetical protein